jgi:hypothetical protein
MKKIIALLSLCFIFGLTNHAKAQYTNDYWQVLVKHPKTLVYCGNENTVSGFCKQIKTRLINSDFATTTDFKVEKKITQEFETVLSNGKVVICTLITVIPVTMSNPTDRFISSTVFVECKFGSSQITIGFRENSSIWLINNTFDAGIDCYRKNRISTYVNSGSEQEKTDSNHLENFIKSIADEIMCTKRVFSSN